MELGKTSYVILGMLTFGPKTGYEIKSLVDVSTRFFWAASYGQIYPELSRLEGLGLVRAERDPADRRRRAVYSLTADGEQALQEWLTSTAPLHLELRHEGALKLFFSDVLDREEQIAQIRRMRAEHEKVAEQLRTMEPGVREAAEESGTPLCHLTLEWGIAYQDFVVDWCRRAERRLSRQPAAAARTA
jgi:PadR family transcriptional regulator, regulatory protein AphA